MIQTLEKIKEQIKKHQDENRDKLALRIYKKAVAIAIEGDLKDGEKFLIQLDDCELELLADDFKGATK